mgnify:CR=1 FL=1
MSHTHGLGCRFGACVHGRPHDDKQAWDHGIDSWHEQEQRRASLDREIVVVLLVLGLVLTLGYLAWSGSWRWFNGLMYAVYERLVP